MTTPRTVFVTDGALRRTLVAARALDRAGFAVTSGEDRPRNLTSASNSTRASFVYPSPRRQPAAFVDRLVRFLTDHRHDVLLPMEQDTLELVLAYRTRFEAITIVPFAATDLFDVFADKASTMALARRHGMPIATTVSPTSPQRASAEIEDLRFPVVVKPRRSWASQGIRFVDDRAAFATVYAEVHRHSPHPIVQERIPVRDKLHVNVLLDHGGHVVAACTILELRHHPPETGPSTAQRSVLRPDLVDLAVSLLRTNDWFGVASVDILIDDRDGSPVIAEVNPRFWGSLNAAIGCGVDFPPALVRLALGHEQSPVIGGRCNAVNRSLLPYDLLYFFSRGWRRGGDSSLFKFGGGTTYDILSRTDPRPTLAFFWMAARFALDPEAWVRLAHMERFGRLVSRMTGRSITTRAPEDSRPQHSRPRRTGPEQGVTDRS